VAPQCPQCGAVRQPAQSSKRRSARSWLFVVFFGLLLIGLFTNNSNEHKISTSTGLPADAGSSKDSSSYRDEKREALNAVTLDFTWSKTGFGNVMEANFTITNASTRDLKDFEIRCEHSANSGTKIDSNTRTIYEVVKAGQKRAFKNFNMGFIHEQAVRSSCRITDAALD
jgi:hypothetical protein